MKTGYATTIGNFDGLHLGHAALIAKIKTNSEKMHLKTKVITFNPYPFEFFKLEKNRILSEFDKRELLANFKIDDVNTINFNDEINKFRSKIDTQIMTLLVKRAPMAIDLRETISSLKISQDLERIGDLSKSNAKKVKPLPLDLPEELLGNLKRLGDLVIKQLNDVLDSYVNKNYDKVRDFLLKFGYQQFFEVKQRSNFFFKNFS